MYRMQSRLKRAALIVAAFVALVMALLTLSGCGVIDSLFDGGEIVIEPDLSTPAPDGAATAPDQSAEATGTDALPPAPRPATASDARKAIDDGARLLSVDTAEDFRVERISGAQNVPLADLAGSAEGWNKTAPVVLTSRSEAQARSAAGFLSRGGFEHVYFLRDGHDGWNGTFEGTDARTLTRPSKLYYLWSSRPALVGENASSVAVPTMRELRANTLDLSAEFEGDVDITIFDLAQSAQSREAWNVMQRHKIAPSTRILGSPVQLVPTWILVDGDGRVTTNVAMNSDGTSISRMSIRSYGWMVGEMERER